ncbi:MAG: efflux RND transporter periplasmic adaptor subunit [Gammaproteobacteria bacterium]|nr:efflux RND transporter periplasmic adaptor subunit [Gammaproteobacteria bacterium]NIR83132.1 efflux RND transporter periplasmic adaptor subunit [Gammaproteobacteria bacterium]NIR90940.1 efflux RND transporter periplasmic adaptor subunit [Gammaproteobacteria bacterium]NIU04297.1 efflux RND transporter periplasmic adaptor subunit [Gammaproteobacteria bacterium]NIV52520.1 efflux RND transporter periplasmic adaptor subunit [Gammaproteobacteria bacterium]
MHRNGARLRRVHAWGVLVPALVVVPALHAQRAPPVDVAVAERAEIIEELPLTGTLTAPRTARLSPEVDGRVAAIAVDAGDRVESGDTLLALDDELAHLELEQADAAVREAEAELADARRRLREARDLIERQSIPQTEVETREAQVQRMVAVVARRKAERAYEKARVERHTLEAPFAGVIARRLTDLGEWVEPGTAVLELVAVDRLRLDLQVPQSYFGRVDRETPVAVRLDALPDRTLEATINEIVPVSDPSARTFLARVGLDNAPGRMTPGMSARATLRIDTGRTSVVVPRDALIRYPDGRVTVWVAGHNSETHTVSEQRVQTGLTFAGRVEIIAGLEAGTPVVVRGNENLREGQQVRVQQRGS